MMIDAIKTPDAVDALAPQLRELWLHSVNPTVFTSPEWITAWWSCFGDGELHALVQRDEGTLVTFAPFFVHRNGEGVAVLTLIGNGNSDYLDITATSRRDVTTIMREILAWSVRHGVGRAEWPHLRGDAVLADAELPAGWGCALHDSAPSPVVRLPWSDSAFDRQMSPKLRKNLHRARHAAEARGLVRFEHASGAAVESVIETLFEMHAARWQATGQCGVLADPRVQRFHRAVARAADAAGMLRLIRLSISGETAGVLYGFTTPAGACYYIGGMNPVMAACSPGALLVREAIHRAIDEGAMEFDFLAGREAYKHQWSAGDRRILHCRLRHHARRASS
jgi:CelD/BcsL family acetyltransferase involved in cellulose biosynthesis